MAFSIVWDENVPVVGEDASNGYARIVEDKVATRERIEVEHDTQADGSGTWRHKFPIVATAVARDALAHVEDGGIVFRRDINAIQVKRAAEASGWLTYYGAFVGETKMYQGAVANIPKGWKLSDGGTYNSFVTADLRGQFIVGTNPGGGGDYDTTNPVSNPKTGGEATHVLVQAELPNVDLIADDHTHQLTGAGGFGQIPTYTGGLGVVTGAGVQVNDATNFQSGNASVRTVPLGGTDTAHENRPQYYALALIVYVGLEAAD